MSLPRIVLRIAVVIFAVEALIMTALPFLEAPLGRFGLDTQLGRTVVDAALLVLLASPVIFFQVIRPFVRARDQAVEQLRLKKAMLKANVAELEDSRNRYEDQSRELVALAENLAEARDQAQAANRAKDTFLANMSHELRTPLNAIIGFSEVIKDETMGPVGSPKYRGYARDIHTAGQHLLSLINDILDLAKVESGADELCEDVLDVASTVDAACLMVRQKAAKQGLSLRLELADRLPALRADERKLKQILVNLLANSVKFTAKGGSVTVAVAFDSATGHVFRVVDTGVGIAPEDIPKALARFGQVENALEGPTSGTGLGLPLAKSLAELHGGSLDLESQVGKGTTVTVRFPASRAVMAPVELVHASVA